MPVSHVRDAREFATGYIVCTRLLSPLGLLALPNALCSATVRFCCALLLLLLWQVMEFRFEYLEAAISAWGDLQGLLVVDLWIRTAITRGTVLTISMFLLFSLPPPFCGGQRLQRKARRLSPRPVRSAPHLSRTWHESSRKGSTSARWPASTRRPTTWPPQGPSSAGSLATL